MVRLPSLATNVLKKTCVFLSLLLRSLATTNNFSVDLNFGYLDDSIHQISV
jgi:hypothetical protein